MVAVAIVGSRLDYCNSLLAGTSASNLARLQMVQNTLARVVAQKSRYCHITPVLAGLHWLPVRHRIDFKIATTAFKVLHHQQPSYLAQILPRYIPSRSLRSSSSITISAPFRKHINGHFKIFLVHGISGSGISCPPMFLPHWHCLFSEGISSIIISLMPTLASLHQPSKSKVPCRPPNAFQPSAYD